MDLLEELKKITQNLDQAGIDYALCGGLAIAIYARPRATLDIDIMVQPDYFSETKKLAKELGYTMSSAMMEFNDGAVKLQRLSKIDKATGEYFVLDLLMATPEIESAWDDRKIVEWEGYSLKVVSPQGMILLKSLRNSGQDKEDIEYLRSLENED
ncbi:MAG TPA: nucleotidyltransferase [Smithellaceae bacterium]|nr:nucleotidyltransferase [Smithellaceae bacterium]HPV51076.1 nucleotidyltransferase [Smithella sp.]